jgi:hypothetical protein
MSKLNLSQPGMNFSLSVKPEVLEEYLKTDVSNMDISQKLSLLNKIKAELKETTEQSIYLSPIVQGLKIHLVDNCPNLYKKLLEQNQLDQFCNQKDNEAIREMDKLVGEGMNYSEAREFVLYELLEMQDEN